MSEAREGGDTRWYKDAILYELHVRAFMDGNGDGKGDFGGLIGKLDYLQDLGVTAIWLLPFYPSPLKDDGYDIADYTSVHPDYGTMRQVRAFIAAAHDRGLRVITELVCNHTSDQHAWFQRARRAPKGSAARDYYVWSDTPDKYRDVRIIFKDFETSNWAWDPVADAYYWHRFYSSQPDLNFDSPHVRTAVLKALDFWLDLGVDGVRLDAIPYLFEREGSNGENLPETHAFIREMRAHIDANYGDRMLLAEANQWPEDSVAYFGNGDECHMCFHFPLMPRMFMAVRMEDRHPILDILDQTPAIPDSAQWALFLRNHDELTLEMVTDEERDYMYRAYAQDPQARINLGIRRRLAPLMGNDRRRIELMNGLLFALPGTPVLYYGDEIGMGDNVYLGDRNGVRTPMQWSGDRNAGFSEANRQQLYLPVITDPEYHYEAVNVEAQQGNPQSLLWWTKRLIALRKQHRVFGRGSLTFLEPENRKVLAFVREFEDERVLVVANLSRFVQYAELDLTAFRGQVPVEMFGQGEFPAIDEHPFVVTLGPHSFYWFQLTLPAQGAVSGDTPAAVLPAAADLEALLTGRSSRAALLRILPLYLRDRRWFGGKARRIREIRYLDQVRMPLDGLDATLVLISVEYGEGEADTYALPLALADDETARTIVRDVPGALVARVGGPTGPALYDACLDPRFDRVLLEAVGASRRFRAASGATVIGHRTDAYKRLRGGRDANVAPSAGRLEQSNTSITYGDRFILKLYRRVESGINPDVEVGRLLTDEAFASTPAVGGWLEYRPERGESTAIGLLQQLVPNQGDVWQSTVGELAHFFERAVTEGMRPPDPGPATAERLLRMTGEAPSAPAERVDGVIGGFLETAALLGTRTAELHLALARPDDPAFAPEPFSALYQRSLYQGMRTQVVESLGLLRRQMPGLPETSRPLAAAVIGAEAGLQARFRALLAARLDGARIRIHGDYHMGQVLWRGRDVVIIDFEGEPGRPLSERRHKRSPLRDVAGMIRSFQYAAQGPLLDSLTGQQVRPEDRAALEPWARIWHVRASATFLGAYVEGMRGSGLIPTDATQLATLLDACLLSKALYELVYELNNRPDWVAIPLRGILELVGGDAGSNG